MKARRSHSGPFSERPFYSDNDIESLCSSELAKVGLLPSAPSPIRIDRYIEKRFGRAHQYEHLEDGVLGLTRFGPNGVEEIVVSEALEEERTKPAERRLRTTLAHEAGHGLLHNHLFVLNNTSPLFGDWSDSQHPRVLCRDPHTGYNGHWWEFQANMVMGTLLLPKCLVEEAIKPYLITKGFLGLKGMDQASSAKAVSALSGLFDVNPVVVQIRLAKLFPSSAASGQLSL